MSKAEMQEYKGHYIIFGAKKLYLDLGKLV